MSNHAQIHMKFAKGEHTVLGTGWGEARALTASLLIDGTREGDYFSITREGKPCIRIYSGAGDTDSLEVEFHTDARSEPLTLSAPWEAIGRAVHLVLVRFLGHRLELIVDDLLMDEEWPMGASQLQDATVCVAESTERADLWDRAISDDEAAELLAGSPVPAGKELEYVGNEPQSIQYWKPRGHNTGVGDCMPFFDGSAFHIYYLFDRRGHRSKWGLGAHQWAHISSINLKDWQHHPMAVGITGQWEGSICTGSVYLEGGTYYAFYAVRAVDGSPARLTWAESQDGNAFEKSGRYIALSDRYLLSSVRDPHVFKDANGIYHMLVTTSLMEGMKKHGCLAHLVSNNLTEWTEAEPLIVPGYHDEPECSDYFEWNGWHYLIFSNDGLARYRYSRSPMGPWLRPAMDVFDCVQWRVPKTAPYPKGRRIAAGFLASPDKYGGELVLRELVQRPDGMLGLKFVPELAEQTAGGQELQSVTLEDMNGFRSYTIGAAGGNYALTFEAAAGYPYMYFGFSAAETGDFREGYDVRFEPSARKVGIHRIHAPAYRQDETSSIYEVEGLDGRIMVEAVVRDGWIDLCVGGSRTLISRIDRKCSHLRLFTQFGGASFERIRIRALT